MNDDQIKHMVDRFLQWRLPENFNPDAGISFDPTFNKHLPVPPRHEPIGTNLLDTTQAEAMVRHMIEGLSIEARRPAMGGEVGCMQDVREELRILMLEQPISGKRETYSDGFASGLAHAIRHIDSVIDPKLERLATSGEGFADEVASLHAHYVRRAAYEECAKVAERKFGSSKNGSARIAGNSIAKAIRALTATTPKEKDDG